MIDLPSPDRFDLLALCAVLGLVVVGHVVYPVRLVTVSAWITNITIFTLWCGYILYRLMYDEPAVPGPVERDS